MLSQAAAGASGESSHHQAGDVRIDFKRSSQVNQHERWCVEDGRHSIDKTVYSCYVDITNFGKYNSIKKD